MNDEGCGGGGVMDINLIALEEYNKNASMGSKNGHVYFIFLLEWCLLHMLYCAIYYLHHCVCFSWRLAENSRHFFTLSLGPPMGMTKRKLFLYIWI